MLFDIRRYFNFVIYLLIFLSVMLLSFNKEDQLLISSIIKNVADV